MHLQLLCFLYMIYTFSLKLIILIKHYRFFVILIISCFHILS